MKRYKILLLTRGRVERQITLKNLTSNIRLLVTIVCHPGELKHHEKKWGGLVEDIVEYDANCTHVGSIREWCINNFKAKNIIFIDDNIKFQARENPDFGEKIKFPLYILDERHFSESSREYILMEMFLWILDKLDDKYGMAGISQRAGNNRQESVEVENTRLFAIWGINVDKYKKIDYRFEDFNLKEDFYVELGFLTSGIPIIASFKYGFDKLGGANNKGGCSTYRNIANSNKSAYQLKKAFPNFVSIKEKSAKNWNGDFKDQDKMIDVYIFWKKAYKFGSENEK